MTVHSSCKWPPPCVRQSLQKTFFNLRFKSELKMYNEQLIPFILTYIYTYIHVTSLIIHKCAITTVCYSCCDHRSMWCKCVNVSPLPLSPLRAVTLNWSSSSLRSSTWLVWLPWWLPSSWWVSDWKCRAILLAAVMWGGSQQLLWNSCFYQLWRGPGTRRIKLLSPFSHLDLWDDLHHGALLWDSKQPWSVLGVQPTSL